MKKSCTRRVTALVLAAAMIATSGFGAGAFQAASIVKAAGTVRETGADSSAEETAAVKADSGTDSETGNDLRLWYDEPTSKGTTILSAGASTTAANNIWQQLTLPIGNGFIGANIYGEIASEHLTFNEKTLWTGGPSESRPAYNGGNIEAKGNNGQTVKEIQALFIAGQDAQASSLCNQLVGTSNGYGCYTGFGDIYMDFGFDGTKATNYTRDLNLNTAIASVQFDYEGVTYEREYFTSYPDNVMVMKLSASEAGSLNFDVRFPSKAGGTPVASGDTIVLKGRLADNQMKYNGQLKAVPTGGTVTADGSKLTVSGADSVVLYISAGTDYADLYDTYRTGQTDAELNAEIADLITNAVTKGYDQVKADHLADYQELFSRVDLDLGQETPTLTTDELLKQYKADKTTKAQSSALEVILFQYGRYLTVASSREGNELPSNLQGMWNDRGAGEATPWNSDYHMNVNLQMNYWPVYSTNLAECAEPLVEYVDALREPGRVTAAIYAGVVSDEENPENGFMAHTQNTPFGWTCPGWDFSWGWSPAAVPWILQNCWEHYEYTGDLAYMEQMIYPMMKEEVKLYEQILIEDPETGRMVSAPAYSPEQGPRTLGNAYEQELIWQLYEDTIKAAELLETDPALVAEWKQTQAKLDPIEVGDDGQIKEWYDETTLYSMGTGANHRHMSQLLALYPGDMITTDTKEWMDAAIVSLTERGDSSTGWGMGQRICSWARTGDGNHAYKLIQSLFDSGMYPNLWDAHPPFQIDGNFGATAGISEMLVQSNAGYINILAALPDAWDAGSVDGLVARGDFEIGIEWSDKKADEITILSNDGGECVVDYDDISHAKIVTGDGTIVEDITAVSPDRVSFESVAGETYTIVPMDVAAEVKAAPAGLAASRTDADSVELSWEAVAGEGTVTYNVFRKIGTGEFVEIKSGITGTTFTDADANEVLGGIEYKLSAVADAEETAMTAAAAVGDTRAKASAITVSSKSGINKISAMGGSLQMKAEITPANAFDKSVTWSVDNTSKATIDANGLLTAVGTENGSVTVKATARDGSGVAGTVVVPIRFSEAEISTIIPNSLSGTAINPAITTSSGWYIWQEAGHLNGKKLETMTLNAVCSYTFTGTGIEIYGEKNADFTKMEITLDGEVQETVSVKNSSDVFQQLLASYRNMENEEHTISIKAVADTAGGTSTKVAIDYFKVISADATAATNTETSEVIEDSPVGTTINPLFGLTGTWYIWSESGQSDGSKLETTTLNSTCTYSFTGTGIELYGQKNPNFTKMEITLDGVAQTPVTVYSATDTKQALLASYRNLENKSHTIVIKAVPMNTGGTSTKISIDFIKIFDTVIAETDKAELFTLVSTASDELKQDKFTASSWAAYSSVFEEAVSVINDADTTADEVAAALTAFEAAKTALVPDPSAAQAPAAPLDLKTTGTEQESFTLAWTGSVGAAKYKIYRNGELLAETEDTCLRVGNLKADTAYDISVSAVSEAGESAAAHIAAKTIPAPDTTAPEKPAGLKASKVTTTSAVISWNASASADTAGYFLYVNGARQAVKGTSVTLTGLEPEMIQFIQVVAADSRGNASSPSVLGFTTVQTVTDPVEAFVIRLYEKVLGRTAAAEEISYYTTSLNAKEKTGADVGRGFVFSPEFTGRSLSNGEYVEMLYETFMGRASDEEGKAYWTNFLDNGVSRLYVFRGFVESAEYTEICESYGISRGSVALEAPMDQNPNLTMYVFRLYDKALGRAAETEGLNFYAGEIGSGRMAPLQAAQNFIFSSEFRDRKLSDSEYIKVLYRTFMGREFDQGGLDYHLNRMDKGTGREEILPGFAEAPEFEKIMAGFGL
ncbi:glycosyl hydrolase family 95 catalytic domain-containing protein [Anaerobium acetethylicum]|uniref:Fibronectin type-III domain-containing protein n=1 Tax=Anaerobium acetethylicum TaxID=1619234 RepID=A0A1D3TSA0_9FIRM|nr:glycoside hydrolase N-terminal domain-containing protein [Anaerobium acetethylicum]SCP96722.1 protein of unknown function [Anaerobium acetethylicum]